MVKLEEMEATCRYLQEHMQQELRALRETIGSSIKPLGERIDSVQASLGQTDTLAKGVEAKHLELAESEKVLAGQVSEAQLLITSVQKGIAAIRTEDLPSQQSAFEELCRQQQEAIALAVRPVAEAVDKLVAGAKENFEKAEGGRRQASDAQAMEILGLRSALGEVRSTFAARCAVVETSLRKTDDVVAAARKAFEEEDKRLAADIARQIGKVSQDVREEIRSSLTVKFEELCEQNLRDMQAMTAEQVAYLADEIETHEQIVRKSAWMIENMYTRAITWSVPGFKKKTFALMRSSDNFLTSPGFSLCSLEPMVMELRVDAQDANGPPLPGRPREMPVPGLCSLRVWAPPGLFAIFRLTVGEGSSGITKRYEHTFEHGELGEVDAHGRVPFVANNVCPFSQAWSRGDDVATFGFELLEFRVLRPEQCGVPKTAHLEVPHLAALLAATHPPAEEAEQFSDATQSKAPAEEKATQALSEAPESKDPAEETEEERLEREERELEEAEEAAAADVRAAQEVELAEGLDDIYAGDDEGTGDIGASRFATCEQALLERLQREQHAMRNRSVRRIEWKLEGCQRLLELCGPGHAIDSPTFSAAGLQGLQFHFYPKGTDANVQGGSANMWCALYVSGPAKTTLRGNLHVGTFSKPFEHRFQKRGDAGGRPRFCNLETSVNDDSVLLALDIGQAEVEIPDSSSTLILREARATGLGATGASGLSGGRGEGGRESALVAGSPAGGARGILKMKRDDPSKVEEIARCVSLPTLNTRERQRPLGRHLGKV